MDAGEDSETSLQQSAADILTRLQCSIPKLLYRNNATEDGYTKKQLRTAVQMHSLHRVLQDLEPFQELPQLLDPALSIFLFPLSEALVQSISIVAEDERGLRHNATSTLAAVSKILYTFCKIRGSKVISRFLHNEAKYITPIVQALEAYRTNEHLTIECLSWETRYILLLWLSHLVLTPFPLSSAGAALAGDKAFASHCWHVPGDMPFIGRICELGVFSLSSSSKERDAAVTLLVRLVLRPDMQKIGLLDEAILWSTRKLGEITTEQEAQKPIRSTYTTIGILSFLAGVFKSAEARAVAIHIMPIFKAVQILNGKPESLSSPNSAVARKCTVKITKSMLVAANSLAVREDDMYSDIMNELAEDAIEDLLIRLSDGDSPVRFAAAKALSIVVVNLETTMAEEVIGAVLSSFEEKVTWSNTVLSDSEPCELSCKSFNDLSLVNPFRWQGLTLTLAHLLFRRAPPIENLPSILKCLLLALSFEQRSTTGSSVGNTVRDGANFGIWSLVRKYSTEEIQSLDASILQEVRLQRRNITVIQGIACALITTACLDLSGNIRRGASAALQELVGRHPDTTVEGIRIVQIVDYHAVALHSKAATNVVQEVAHLCDIYRQCLLTDLLGWRGITAADAKIRRICAKTFSYLAEINGETGIKHGIEFVWGEILVLQTRDVEKRHGLLIALSRLIAALRRYFKQTTDKGMSSKETWNLVAPLWSICDEAGGVNESSFTSFNLRPALTAEAVCYLLQEISGLTIDVQGEAPIAPVQQNYLRYLELSAGLKDKQAIEMAGKAASAYLELFSSNLDLKSVAVTRWIDKTKTAVSAGPGRQSAAPGWLCILASAFGHLDEDSRQEVLSTFVLALNLQAEIETKVAALENLQLISYASDLNEETFKAVKNCLQDYTTDRRGDVGSLVRIAALRYIKNTKIATLQKYTFETRQIDGIICGLAAEKLDKVRAVAFESLNSKYCIITASDEPQMSVSDTLYFTSIINFAQREEMLDFLLAGLASSVSGASEPVSRAARRALSLFLASSDTRMLLYLLEALTTLLQKSLYTDRISVMVLETIAFALQTRSFSDLYKLNEAATCFKALFIFTQKAHLKTTSVPKLQAAIEVYECLADVKFVHTSVLKKLIGMLIHPFPMIRQSTADTLYCVTNDASILPVDWLLPPSSLKVSLESVRSSILGAQRI